MKTIIPFVARLPAQEQHDWIAALAAELPDAQIVPVAELASGAGHRTAIVANPNPHDLAALCDLEWVQSLWAGVEKLVVEPALASLGIARLIDPCLANTMAEAVLAWTLYLHRDMPQYHLQQNQRTWRQLPYVAVADRRIGILGLGELGQASAHRLSQNDFDVMGWSRSQKSLSGIRCFHGQSGLDAMIAESDILICLLPLTAATRGMIAGPMFAALPTGASLINFGRGPIVDAEALTKALDSGHMKHAVLDVFDEEPLSAGNPLWAHASITVLPHIAAPTSMVSAAKIVADNIKNFLNSGTLPPLVDRARGY